MGVRSSFRGGGGAEEKEGSGRDAAVPASLFPTWKQRIFILSACWIKFLSKHSFALHFIDNFLSNQISWIFLP